MDPMSAQARALDDRLIESVPNVSEGRRLDVVERLANAIASVPGVHLLDRTSDASHNRSVFTLAGPAGPVADALEQLVAAAVREIDMDAHWGEHPRIGAVDVIPFVPLGDTTMDETVDIARDFGARIAERFDLPVYLYAQAARRSDRVQLADVRRGQYEGLKAEIGQHGREPDLGPTRMHPSAGAVAVEPVRSSSPTTSTSTHPTSTSPSGSPAGSVSPAAGCRRSRPTGSRSPRPRPVRQKRLTALRSR